MEENIKNNLDIDKIFNEDFAVVILSYKNPDNCRTLNALKAHNYTGNYYLIIGTDDPKIEEYKIKHKDHLLIFNKDDYENKIDMMDQGGTRGIGVYARMACYDAIKSVGKKYFLVLDDDYNKFRFRMVDSKNPKILRAYNIYHLNEIIKESLHFYISIPRIKAFCWSQAGDCIGGINSSKWKKQFLRKCMNSWFCDIDRPVIYKGRMNDDTNAYTYWGSKGELFITYMPISIEAEETQAPNTGMADAYKEGTYRKTFYTIMHSPSFTKAFMMGTSHFRFHHNILWKNAVPLIISDKYKKK